MPLTEKMKRFAREYYKNGGNGTQAYLTAYDGSSTLAATQESIKLLKRDDINEYLKTLAIPNENKAISERQKKRQWLWDMIENPSISESDRLRAMDILNKMDSEYIQTTHSINESKTNISGLDTDTLKQLISNKKEE